MERINDNQMTVNGLLEKYNLNWTVRREDLKLADGTNTKHVAIVREDINAVLGVHKGETKETENGIILTGYQPFQNQAMAELIFELSNRAVMPVHSAGFLGNGEKVFIQLKSDDLRLNGDIIKGFATIVNSFDGSTAIGLGGSTITISCRNTFHRAYRDLAEKIKHTLTMQARIDTMLRLAENFRKEEQKHYEVIRKLAAAAMSQVAEKITYETLFPVKYADMVNNPDAVSTRTKNNIDRFKTAITHELATKENTLWGYFSAATYYSTHLAGVKEDSKMFGSVAAKEQALFNKFAELVA